jgi:hypothetical protein
MKNIFKGLVALGIISGLILGLPKFIKSEVYGCPTVIPTISGIYPNAAYPGTFVTIYGSGFLSGGSTVYFGNDRLGWKSLTIKYSSLSKIIFVAPGQNTISQQNNSYKDNKTYIYVEACGGKSEKYHFTVIQRFRLAK